MNKLLILGTVLLSGMAGEVSAITQKDTLTVVNNAGRAISVAFVRTVRSSQTKNGKKIPADYVLQDINGKILMVGYQNEAHELLPRRGAEFKQFPVAMSQYNRSVWVTPTPQILQKALRQGYLDPMNGTAVAVGGRYAWATVTKTNTGYGISTSLSRPAVMQGEALTADNDEITETYPKNINAR